MRHTVFVFGTLKEGFPNFGVNRGERVPGSYATKDAYPLFLIGERHVPWMMHEPGGGLPVQGQVFRVDQAGLDAMDRLERVGEPDGYVRLLLDVCAIGTGSTHAALSAFAYLKPAHHLDRGQVRLGPLAEYTLEHAALYRPRG